MGWKTRKFWKLHKQQTQNSVLLNHLPLTLTPAMSGTTTRIESQLSSTWSALTPKTSIHGPKFHSSLSTMGIEGLLVPIFWNKSSTKLFVCKTVSQRTRYKQLNKVSKQPSSDSWRRLNKIMTNLGPVQ